MLQNLIESDIRQQLTYIHGGDPPTHHHHQPPVHDQQQSDFWKKGGDEEIVMAILGYIGFAWSVYKSEAPTSQTRTRQQQEDHGNVWGFLETRIMMK